MLVYKRFQFEVTGATEVSTTYICVTLILVDDAGVLSFNPIENNSYVKICCSFPFLG
jgi:hypothetical protein